MGLTGDHELDGLAARITNADVAASREWLRRLRYGELSTVERRVAVLAGLYADEGGGHVSMTEAGSAFLREQGARLGRLEKVAADGLGGLEKKK